MGNRALIQVINTTEVSPTLYLHHHADDVERILEKWWILMETRRDDVSYGFARLVGICHEHIEGNLSLGVWNTDEMLTEADSHGDGGVFLVNAKTGGVSNMGNCYKDEGTVIFFQLGEAVKA